MLGPSADYIGGEIKGLVEKCNINLDNIFFRAKEKIGGEINEPGEVNLRVLKRIINEGCVVSDKACLEYFAGILATARTKNGKDDQDISHLSTIERLSSYQLRLHYLFYRLVANTFNENDGYTMDLKSDRPNMRLFIPESVYVAAMEFDENESPQYILPHAVTGLVVNQLVGEFRFYGEKDRVRDYLPEAGEKGVILEPSLFGSELYLRAEGLRDATGYEIVCNNLGLSDPVIPILSGCIPLVPKSMLTSYSNKNPYRRDTEC